VEQEEIKAIIENILLAADQPVSETQFKNLLGDEVEKVSFKSALEELIDEYNSRNLQILQVAEGYQLCTRHDYSDWVRKFLKFDKTTKLSQPSLDTLAIIAYKQPLTRLR
jgi:segregation and condensation protein B